MLTDAKNLKLNSRNNDLIYHGDWADTCLMGESPRGGVGYFVINDQGKSFDFDNWTEPDLNNPTTRRRGRGLGWKIIHSSMKKVTYSPKTTAGNLTLLWFDPAKHETR